MPTFEFFDRLASDLSLNEIIAARLKKKVWSRIARRAGGVKADAHAAGAFDPAIAEKLRKLRLSLTSNVKPKPPVTHMKRSVLLKRITEFNARLDKIILGEDQSGKVTEFAFLPALAGGIVGSGLGARAGKKKWNPETGRWEDDPLTSAAGGIAGAGAGYGLGKLHGSVMSNYGGEGGWKEAYRNVGRNVAAQAGEKVSGVIGPKATTAIQDIHGIAKAEGGMALENIAKKFKALKGAGTKALRRFFSEGALPRELVEFESRIDAIVFAQKKSPIEESATRKGQTPATNLRRGIGAQFFVPGNPIFGLPAGAIEAREYTKAGQVLKKRDVDGHAAIGTVSGVIGAQAAGRIARALKVKNPFGVLGAHLTGGALGYGVGYGASSRNTLKKRSAGLSATRKLTEFARDDQKVRIRPVHPVAAYLAGLGTIPAVGAVLGAATGPGRHMLAGAAEALRVRRYRKMSNIPANKVVEYLRMLHAGKIKA